MIDPEIQKALDDLSKRIDDNQGPRRREHFHDGKDLLKVKFDDLDRRKFYITHNIVGTAAATAANYSTFFVNEIGACVVSGFWERHQTAGTDAGAVTVGLEKVTDGTAPASGVSVLASELSLKATVNTVQTGTLTTTLANRNLALGDGLALEDTGTLTAVANVTVLVELTLTI